MNLIQDMPEPTSTSYAQWIYDRVSDGSMQFDWQELNGIQQMQDAMYFIDDDGCRFRPPVSEVICKHIAGMIGAQLISADQMDDRYINAELKLDATILPAGPDMQSKAHSIKMNKMLETKRNGFVGLIADCGKAWLNAPQTTNYGYYDINAPYQNAKGIKLWQNKGYRHDKNYSDASQIALFVKPI